METVDEAEELEKANDRRPQGLNVAQRAERAEVCILEIQDYMKRLFGKHRERMEITKIINKWRGEQ